MDDITLGQIIVWIIIGTLAGYMAGRLVKKRSFGFVTSLIVGLVGALIGAILFRALDLNPTSGILAESVQLGEVLVAFVGAVVLVVAAGLVPRN